MTKAATATRPAKKDPAAELADAIKAYLAIHDNPHSHRPELAAEAVTRLRTALAAYEENNE